MRLGNQTGTPPAKKARATYTTIESMFPLLRHDDFPAFAAALDAYTVDYGRDAVRRLTTWTEDGVTYKHNLVTYAVMCDATTCLHYMLGTHDFDVFTFYRCGGHFAIPPHFVDLLPMAPANARFISGTSTLGFAAAYDRRACVKIIVAQVSVDDNAPHADQMTHTVLMAAVNGHVDVLTAMRALFDTTDTWLYHVLEALDAMRKRQRTAAVRMTIAPSVVRLFLGWRPPVPFRVCLRLAFDDVAQLSALMRACAAGRYARTPQDDDARSMQSLYGVVVDESALLQDLAAHGRLVRWTLKQDDVDVSSTVRRMLDNFVVSFNNGATGDEDMYGDGEVDPWGHW